MNRRAFLMLAAALTAAPLIRAGAAPTATPMPAPIGTGQALGTVTSIRLAHPQAEAIAARAAAEIRRLDEIFSLYRADSALAILNRDGRLPVPPFELLDCLAIAGAVHAASGGAFDPTVQPLWQLWAEAASRGTIPDAQALAETRARTGWDGVAITPEAITLRPGMALTLNGIAQGYLADRVAALLRAEGLSDLFIDTGEFHALGDAPDGAAGAGWPVTLVSGEKLALRDRGLATSAPKGTTFDAAGRLGHILDPRAGGPVPLPWASVSISAGSAALADALATAACLAPDRAAMDAMLAPFPDARIEAAAER